MNKLGVIIPYRDRHEHLLEFRKSITDYLNAKEIPFELIIVEQDNAKTFNRGKLLNIGFKQAKILGCNYVVFHDVDMVPIEVDYSYTEVPTHLATERASFEQYFGGVTLFPVELFEKVNGYSNEYWGWGFEDDDLFYRCTVKNVPLDKRELKIINSHTAALKLNGLDAYVEGINKSNSSRISLFLFFEPYELVLDHEAYDDDFVALYLPELDLRVSYDSYQKYKVVIGNGKKASYITSKKLPAYKTNICVTIDKDNRLVEMYQDGKFVGSTKYSEDVIKPKEKQFSLGSDTKNLHFKGNIFSFALYEDILSETDIKEIAENKFFGLTQDFGNYKASSILKFYYDAKFVRDYKLIDLVSSNKAILHNCEIIPYTCTEFRAVDIPFRKKSKFMDLRHEDNGFIGGSWKNITTRYNQLRYTNEVIKGYTDITTDGLNTCKYKEFSKVRSENETHLVVGI